MIMVVILINTLMLVLSTWRSIEVRFDYYFTVIDGIFMAVYVSESALKIYVHRLEYFKEGWDVLGEHPLKIQIFVDKTYLFV